MKISIAEFRTGHGKQWSVRRDGIYFASFGYSFMPRNSGAMFAANHSTAAVKVFVDIQGEKTEEILPKRASYQRDAEKLAREWFNEKDIRATLKAKAIAAPAASPEDEAPEPKADETTSRGPGR
jgi:hypothetical protein